MSQVYFCIGLVGSGPMVRKAVKRLNRRGFRNLILINRTVEKVRRLAADHDARVVSLPDFLADPIACDVILSATSAPGPIFTPTTMRPVLSRRNGSGDLLMVDLAVPRDIDPELDEHERVQVVAVDDLRAIAERNAEDRASRAREAESFIDRGLESFSRKLAASVPAAAGPA